MRDPEAGFTLLEALVALALTGFVALLLFEGMRFTNRAWVVRSAEDAAHVQVLAASSALRHLIDDALPARLRQEVAGSATRFGFLAETGTGVQAVTLSLVGESLQAELRPLDAETPERRSLATGLSAMSFRYLDAQGTWSETWERPDALPRLVEIRLVQRSLRHWPAIVVAPGRAPVPD